MTGEGAATDPVPGKPLNTRPGIVLITRPEPGASETAARIAAMGLTPIVAPVLEIRPTPVRPPPREKIAAIVLASGNAIDPLPASFRDLPVLTVGAATARRARDTGFTNVTSANGDAAALVTLVRTRLKAGEGTLLLAAGRGQSLALAASLRADGYRVTRRVVYAARRVAALPEAARAALLGGRPLTVLFFSTETVRWFVLLVVASGLADTLRGCDAITIGAQVGMALKAVNWARVRVAGQPTQDAMLALLR
jgi:uroporphyrinogen-III synthase